MKISWLLFLVKYTRRSVDWWGLRRENLFWWIYIFLKSSPLPIAIIQYIPIWLGRWQEPLLKMSPLSLSLFLMTFLLLNGHDFCVPPSMNFLSLCTIQLMIILILSLQKPLLYLSLCNLPIAICALNCELNVWERSQISKPYMPLWLDVSCFLIHISKFLCGSKV